MVQRLIAGHGCDRQKVKRRMLRRHHDRDGVVMSGITVKYNLCLFHFLSSLNQVKRTRSFVTGAPLYPLHTREAPLPRPFSRTACARHFAESALISADCFRLLMLSFVAIEIASTIIVTIYGIISTNWEGRPYA